MEFVLPHAGNWGEARTHGPGSFARLAVSGGKKIPDGGEWMGGAMGDDGCVRGGPASGPLTRIGWVRGPGPGRCPLVSRADSVEVCLQVCVAVPVEVVSRPEGSGPTPVPLLEGIR